MRDWELIVRTHGPNTFETAWRLLGNVTDAEDVAQETLLQAFQLYQRESIDNWGGLLCRIATRRSIDRLRKRQPLPLAHEPAANASHQPEATAIERELAERLRKAISELTDREASVFSLRYFSELSNSEIAQVLELTTNAVGVALNKARKRLKTLLQIDDVTHSHKKTEAVAENRGDLS